MTPDMEKARFLAREEVRIEMAKIMSATLSVNSIAEKDIPDEVALEQMLNHLEIMELHVHALAHTIRALGIRSGIQKWIERNPPTAVNPG